LIFPFPRFKGPLVMLHHPQASRFSLNFNLQFTFFLFIYIISWHLTFSTKHFQRSNGISGVAELTNGLGISKGIDTEEETINRTSWLKPAFLMRTRSATNSVVQQILVDPPAPWLYLLLFFFNCIST
jgi:hypothetical protein